MNHVNIYTVKHLKRELENYDEDDFIVVQMIDGEYDAVGFIDFVSMRDDATDYFRDCLPEKYEDAVMLICGSSRISSQY